MANILSIILDIDLWAIANERLVSVDNASTVCDNNITEVIVVAIKENIDFGIGLYVSMFETKPLLCVHNTIRSSTHMCM